MIGLIFRLLLKAFVPLSIVFGVMFYLMYLNGQNPMAVFDGFGNRVLSVLDNAGSSISNLPEKVEDVVEDDARTFYKWQDTTGAWHYGEDPPANAQALTAITLRLTENVVPAFKDPQEEVEENEEEETPVTLEAPTIASPYSPDQIKKLFEDTQQLQETINQRQLDQNKLLGIDTKE